MAAAMGVKNAVNPTKPEQIAYSDASSESKEPESPGTTLCPVSMKSALGPRGPKSAEVVPLKLSTAAVGAELLPSCVCQKVLLFWLSEADGVLTV